MTKIWIVVDIGCYECNENTIIVGVYNKENEATKKFLNYLKSKNIDYLYDETDTCVDYFNPGQHTVQIFEEELNES